MSIVRTIIIIVQVVEMLGYGLQAKMNLKLTKSENSDVSISHDSDRSEQPSDTNLEQILSLD